MGEEKGYIYILTNKSFRENCIKIGYSNDVERRVKDLSGTGMPYDYEIYATYEVPPSRGADKALHSLIQLLNPQLRIQPNREFFEIDPKDALRVLQYMAIIHDNENALHVYGENDEEKSECHKKGEIFSFSKCQIPIGSIIKYIDNPEIECKVVDDRKISYKGEIMYMTTLAKKLTNKEHGVAGPKFFSYNNIPLDEYYEKYQNKK